MLSTLGIYCKELGWLKVKEFSCLRVQFLLSRKGRIIAKKVKFL